MYRIVFSNDAQRDLKELSKKTPQAVKKLSKLLEEIQEHPRTGTGQVEPLKGYDGDVYSRRITQGHRFVYREVVNLTNAEDILDGHWIQLLNETATPVSGCYTLGLETFETTFAGKGCHPLREFPLTLQI